MRPLLPLASSMPAPPLPGGCNARSAVAAAAVASEGRSCLKLQAVAACRPLLLWLQVMFTALLTA
jgi:hypothetical protein